MIMFFILVGLMLVALAVLMYSALIVSSDYDDFVEEWEREQENADNPDNNVDDNDREC